MKFGVASKSLDRKRKALGLMRRYVFIGARDECIAFLAKEFKKRKLHALFDDVEIYKFDTAPNGENAREPWTTTEIFDHLAKLQALRAARRKAKKLLPSDDDAVKEENNNAATSESKVPVQEL